MFNRGASEQLYFMSRAAVRQSPWSPTRLCQRGDVTCNCAHPSPCNRAARRSRGLWRLARFQAAAHQVCELNNSSAAQSVTFFFAGVPGRRATLTIHTDGGETPWAVSERAHRPRPCSDNPPPPWIFPHVQLQERHVLVRGTLCWWNLFFVVFFSTRRKEIQQPRLNLKMRPFFFVPSLQCGAVAWRSPLCQGSPVMMELGRRECFPPVRRVCLGGGKITGWRQRGIELQQALSGTEDRDGSLSAGHWLDPSPQLPRSTHTGNWSWQEVGMHPSLFSSLLPSSSLPSFCFLYVFFFHFLQQKYKLKLK